MPLIWLSCNCRYFWLLSVIFQQTNFTWMITESSSMFSVGQDPRGFLLQHSIQCWNASAVTGDNHNLINTCIKSFPWAGCSSQFSEVAVINIPILQMSKQFALKHTGNIAKKIQMQVFLTPNLKGLVAVLPHCFHFGLEFLQWWVHHYFHETQDWEWKTLLGSSYI